MYVYTCTGKVGGSHRFMKACNTEDCKMALLQCFIRHVSPTDTLKLHGILLLGKLQE